MSKKILAIFVALAMMFAFVGMASAEEAGTIDVAWYGYNYSGYFDFATNIDDVYAIGDYDMNYVGYARTGAVIPSTAFSMMDGKDVVGFTMLFSEDLNPLNTELLCYLEKYNPGLCSNPYCLCDPCGCGFVSVANPPILISTFAEDYDGVSWAPEYFTIRDTYENGNTATSDVADAWFDAMDIYEIDAWTSDWADFLILMEAIAPEV